MPVPSGIIIGWVGTHAGIPTGWTRATAYDGLYPKAHTSTAGSTGGSNTHTHTTSAGHTHTAGHSHSSANAGGASGGGNRNVAESSGASVRNNATHSVSFATDSTATSSAANGSASSSGNNEPPYVEFILIKSSGTHDFPVDSTLFINTTTAPTTWAKMDGTAASPDMRGKYMKVAATSGNGGGTGGATHTHTLSHDHGTMAHSSHAVTVSTSSHASTGADTISGAAFTRVNPSQSHTHTHNITTDSASPATGTDATASDSVYPEPANHRLWFIKKTGSLGYEAEEAGLIAMWDGSTGSVPSGWVVCDGTQGTPDLSNVFLKGAANDGDVGGTSAANTSHTHSISHTHSVAAHTHATSGSIDTISQTTTSQNGGGAFAITIVGNPHTHAKPANTGAVSGTTSSGSITLPSSGTDPSYKTIIYIQFVGLFFLPWLPASHEVVDFEGERSKRERNEDIVSRIVAYANSFFPFGGYPFEITPTLRWRSGGRLQVDSTLLLRLGGRLQKSPMVKWRIDPSPNRVEWALQGRFGSVVYHFRFERRTNEYQYVDDVTNAIISCEVELNNDRDVLRTARFSIDANATYDDGSLITIDPLADHIAIQMVLLVDNEYELDIPMGIFSLDVPKRRIEPTAEVWDVAASDFGIHLVESTTTSSYRVASGANYITGTNGVQDILDTVIGTSRYVLPHTSSTLPTDMTWAAGTPWLRVVNDLLHGCNMYSLWYDAKGVARTQERIELATRTPDVTYTGDDFILVPIEEETDTTRFANQVVVVVNDPNRAPISSIATNTNPSSPISTVSLGRTVTKVITRDKAADQTVLDAIAEREVEEAASVYKRAVFLTPIDPRREAHEVYTITVEGVYEAETWWARNWTMALQTGAQMKHTIGKVTKIS